MVLFGLPSVCLVLLVARGTCNEEHQEPLDVFSNHCCAKGLYLRKDVIGNQTCYSQDGTSIGQTINTMLHCPEGMFLLNPNDDETDTFREVDGEIEINAFYDTGEETIVPNGSWCAANLIPGDGNLTVALVCADELDYEGGTVHYLYGVCLFVSCLFLLATLTVYVLLPELRDFQGLCLMANIFSLMLGYFALSFIQLFGHSADDDICVFSAFFLYYWLLSSFFWLNIVAFNVWRNIVNQGSRSSDGPRLFAYIGYGWGIPIIFLIAAICVHYAPDDYENLYRPRFGETSCWFQGPEETWIYFYAPVCLIIITNMYFFVTLALQIWRFKNATTTVKSKKFKWMLYLKLFIVTGITWFFEVASFAEGSKSWFWYITDVLNCLQGIFYFFILIWRQRVLRVISSSSWGYKILGDRFQEQAEELNSDDEDAIPEEIELANP